MAYLTDSEMTDNTVTVGKVKIELEEPNYLRNDFENTAINIKFPKYQDEDSTIIKSYATVREIYEYWSEYGLPFQYTDAAKKALDAYLDKYGDCPGYFRYGNVYLTEDFKGWSPLELWAYQGITEGLQIENMRQFNHTQVYFATYGIHKPGDSSVLITQTREDTVSSHILEIGYEWYGSCAQGSGLNAEVTRKIKGDIVKTIIPNQIITKDPQVENSGSNTALVYLKVEVPQEDITALDENNNKGTKQTQDLFTLKDVSSQWELIRTETLKDQTTGKSKTSYVYAYKKPLESGKTTDKLFQQVQVKNFIEKDIESNVEDIIITAGAIQSTNVSGIDLTSQGDGTIPKEKLDKVYDIFLNQSGDKI